MPESRQMGRPRSESARKAILEATFTLLVERGYDALALEAVARVAGVGKSTIYRWWQTKAELAVEAFFEATADELKMPQTNDARADFHAQIGALATLLAGTRGRAFAAMLGGALNDPALARVIGARWLDPRQRWGRERMARAAAEGQLKPGVEPRAALAVLYGPLYTPLLFGGEVPAAEAVQAYLNIACNGIFTD
ncbi:MAG: TetR/AcrR family transcriptional regulator [Sphingomonadales bacterium]|nr:TetR/AcrR family transcriptional regulator [Sphingomonadales bacterium]